MAEVGQAHDGSFGTAHAYVDAVADAGADAVKFQTHIAAAESTPGEPWRVQFSKQDATRFDYWKRMEFSVEQWKSLRDHALDRKLIFLSSAFSFEAVELLASLDMAAWKVGSGEITNLPLIEKMAATGRPVLLSSGLSGWVDLDHAVEAVRKRGAPVAVMQCTTAYPCPPEKLGLNLIPQLRERYSCPIGFSDHSGTVFASIAAVTLGAELLEVHVVFSRRCFGPDTPASVTIDELGEVVRGVRFVETASANPVDKDLMAGELSELRRVFGKSLVAARDLPAGHVLTDGDVAIKKPGTGIPAARLREVLGRKLGHAVTADTLLAETDLV